MVSEYLGRPIYKRDEKVLILVLMEHGLGDRIAEEWTEMSCLNPCSNGTWSRRQMLCLEDLKE